MYINSRSFWYKSNFIAFIVVVVSVVSFADCVSLLDVRWLGSPDAWHWGADRSPRISPLVYLTSYYVHCGKPVYSIEAMSLWLSLYTQLFCEPLSNVFGCVQRRDMDWYLSTLILAACTLLGMDSGLAGYSELVGEEGSARFYCPARRMVSDRHHKMFVFCLYTGIRGVEHTHTHTHTGCKCLLC